VPLAIVACATLLCATTARAATGHKFQSSLTETAGGAKLGEPDAVAVEKSTGRLFVADRATGEVDDIVIAKDGFIFLDDSGNLGLNCGGVIVFRAKITELRANAQQVLHPTDVAVIGAPLQQSSPVCRHLWRTALRHPLVNQVRSPRHNPVKHRDRSGR